MVREPLLHFLILGSALWALIAVVQHENDERIIRVGPEVIQQLTQRFQAQHSKPPSDKEFDALLKQYIDDEIAYREGISLGLGQGDEIVRRRIIQKFRFLQDDLNIPQEVSDKELRAWFLRRLEDYTVPPRVSFRQVYFSPDVAGGEDARMRAIIALRLLKSGEDEVVLAADQFAGPAVANDQSPESIERMFGKSQISEELFEVPQSRWLGPFRSGFGWHLIFVDRRTEEEPREFEAVRDLVRRDYIEEQQALMNERAFSSIRSNYRVLLDKN